MLHVNEEYNVQGFGMSVLIYTEHKEYGDELAVALQQEGLKKPLVATDPILAVKTIGSGSVDAVLADWRTDQSTALKLLIAIRKKDTFRSLPFIALAGEHAKRPLQASAKDPSTYLLEQPVSPDVIVAEVKRRIGGERVQPLDNYDVFSAALLLIEQGKYAKALQMLAMLEQEGQEAVPMHLAVAICHLQEGDKRLFKDHLSKASCIARNVPCPATESVVVPPIPEKPEETQPSSTQRSGVWQDLSPEAKRRKASEFYKPAHDERAVYRVFAPYWGVRFSDATYSLQVIDLSLTGAGAEAPLPALDKGTVLKGDLLIESATVLEDMEMRIVRVGGETIGIAFENMTPAQEAQLNKKFRDEQVKAQKTAKEFVPDGLPRKQKVYKLDI